LRALEMAHQAGVQIAYGTDLLGGMHVHQLREFEIRAQVQPAADIIRSATIVGARLVRRDGRIGSIEPGKEADLLVVDGNPLVDIGVLTRPDQHLVAVLKSGRFYRRDFKRAS
jgi:imidazolonepropionase-like amidohydrolase